MYLGCQVVQTTIRHGLGKSVRNVRVQVKTTKQLMKCIVVLDNVKDIQGYVMPSVTFKRNNKQFTELVSEQWKGTTIVGKVTVFPLILLGLLFILFISHIILVCNWFYTTGSSSLYRVFFKVNKDIL